MRPAIANLTIIGLNVFMFLLEFILGDSFIEVWAFTPTQLTAFFHRSGSFQSVLTIFTSMFMRAGLSHLFGNMLFLSHATDNNSLLVDDTPAWYPRNPVRDCGIHLALHDTATVPLAFIAAPARSIAGLSRSCFRVILMHSPPVVEPP